MGHSDRGYRLLRSLPLPTEFCRHGMDSGEEMRMKLCPCTTLQG